MPWHRTEHGWYAQLAHQYYASVTRADPSQRWLGEIALDIDSSPPRSVWRRRFRWVWWARWRTGLEAKHYR